MALRIFLTTLLCVSWMHVCGQALPAEISASALRIPGVVEPPELTGEPKLLKRPTPAQQAFASLIKNFNEKDKEATRQHLPELNKFIEERPLYSDAYLMRALVNGCILESQDFASLLHDVDMAISTHSAFAEETTYDNLADHYSLRGKVNLAMGRRQEAMNDLSEAMQASLSSAEDIFNTEATKPERSSKPCTWNLTDFDNLAINFPRDQRPLIFRGLYFTFFTTFNEDTYSNALGEFKKAAAIDTRSPLSHYFIGKLYTKASFWTKAAWSSDAARNEIYNKAIRSYSDAIQLDPKFREAYEMRASAYEGLKEYTHAIGDHNKVLELDPENVIAFADRGLDKLEIGEYLDATSDFGSAIRLKKDNYSSGTTYEYRGDAYVKINEYANAIRDYSKAIERELANETFLLSLKQIRGLYPEYKSVSDEAICRKINLLFWPQFDYNIVANKLLHENGEWAISGLNGLYEKRGDAYLQAHDFRRGALDFVRIFDGIPNWANTVDRWRLLGNARDGEQYYLDVKSFQATTNGPIALWIKNISAKKTYTINSYDIDCHVRKINQTSTAAYDAKGIEINASELESGWQRIIPDTIGEHLFDGSCMQTY